MRNILIVILILIVVIAVTAYLNTADIDDRLASQRESIIYTSVAGVKGEDITFSDMENLEETVFSATLRSSDGRNRDYTYEGVQLRDVIEELIGINITEYNQVVVTAVDGYAAAFDIDEILEEDNMYVVYKRDGEPLKSREEGGVGPYQIVIRKDTFGQRWVKYMMEIDIK